MLAIFSLMINLSISNYISKFYYNLFNQNHHSFVLQILVIPSSFFVRNEVIMPITFKEVKRVVFASSKNFSPCPYSFTFEFFVASWDVVGISIFLILKHFFPSYKIHRRVKFLGLSFIPKLAHASLVGDYKLMSLCNTFYKTIVKILGNKITTILPLIIHLAQARFNKKNLSIDNYHFG